MKEKGESRITNVEFGMSQIKNLLYSSIHGILILVLTSVSTLVSLDWIEKYNLIRIGIRFGIRTMNWANAIRGYESNRWRFGFQAGQFRSSISIQFKTQQRIRVDYHNFDLNSIIVDRFWSFIRLKPIKINHFRSFFIKRSKKTIYMSIIWLKNVKNPVILTIFDLNWTIFYINGPDLNRIIVMSRLDHWNWIEKVD